MVRDIGDLLGEEPRVERVEYDAHPRRTVPGGKMASTVPTHRRNAVAGLYPLRRERVRHALRVRADVGIGRSGRSDEHTSELQSLMRISSAVFCLKQNKSQ